MKNTGVYVDKGDTYSILATGSINRCPSRSCRNPIVKPEDGWPFLVRIGKKGYYFRPLYSFNTYTETIMARPIHGVGHIYIGYYSGGKPNLHGEPPHPEWYADDTGGFSVDIIVWEREDWVQIADFFEKMKQEDPENKAIIETLDLAKKYKEIYLASEKASKQIEATKKELQELKGSPEEEKGKAIKTTKQEKITPQTKPPTVDVRKQERAAQLEVRLAKLTETLAQLEVMKKQLEEERKKTDLLTEQLAEKERTEKNLLMKLEDGSKTPPVIVIASPKDESKVEVNIIHLTGVAEDDLGLAHLEIFINDKPIKKNGTDRGLKVTAERYPTRLDFNEKIVLQKGENQIRIRAVDSDGLWSENTVTVHKLEIRRNIWAVIIGINAYPNVRQLKFAVNDARIFYDHLVNYNRIPAENVTLLVDKEATLTKLRSALGTHLKNKGGKEDMVIIFFAGHGATEKDVMSPDGDGLEKYLLPYDADPKDLYATALPMGEISRIFRRIRSERLVFIADSCYSGASGGRTIDIKGMRTSISDAFLDRIATGKGRVIITASGANEVSAENDELKHGVFTYYLVEGLRGMADADEDGLITVDEVYRYVSNKVPQATGQEQHPVKKGTVEGHLILGITQ